MHKNLAHDLGGVFHLQKLSNLRIITFPKTEDAKKQELIRNKNWRSKNNSK